MRKLLAALFAAWTLFAVCGSAEEADPAPETNDSEMPGFTQDTEAPVDYAVFFTDLIAAHQAVRKVDEDAEALDDEMAFSIADSWKRFYLDPDYRILLHGTDDPARLSLSGRHAFVVLGFELADGEMTEELKERCDAAAAAANAFPDSILVCSGGASGDNNPQRHTEAGLMKEYLVENCGVDGERIFTDERAQDTAENALNTFEILKAQEIEEITIVTSDYHQKRANLLFSTLAAFIEKTEGYSVRITGNYASPAEGPYDEKTDAMIAAFQTSSMLTYLTSGGREAREIVVNYGAYGEKAAERNGELFARMRSVNPEAAEKWTRIMELWKEVNSDGFAVHEGILPDGLPDTDELCIVALGFQLNPDGSMRDELIERLEVVLRSAEKYPNAIIACTGGGTAAENEEATEADRMAEWLVSRGISPDRILVENESKTTAQNAMFTLTMLKSDYPQVRQLAIVSSDYHIPTGTLLFEAQSILDAEDPAQRVKVVSNAAWAAPSGSLSVMFQAGALVELSGDEATAYEIYYETYDIHELPSRE